MKEILLTAIMLAALVCGYFVMGRVGRLLKKGSRSFKRTEEPGDKLFIVEAVVKSVEEISKEDGAAPGEAADAGDKEIIICRITDMHAIEGLNGGCPVK